MLKTLLSLVIGQLAFHFFHVLLSQLPLFMGCQGLLYYTFIFFSEDGLVDMKLSVEFLVYLMTILLTGCYFFFFKLTASVLHINYSWRVSKISLKNTVNFILFLFFLLFLLNRYKSESEKFDDEYSVEFLFFFGLYLDLTVLKGVNSLYKKYWKNTYKQDIHSFIKIHYLFFLIVFLILWSLVFGLFEIFGFFFFLIFYFVSRVLLSTNYIYNLIFLILFFLLVSISILLFLKFDFLSFTIISLYVGGVLVLFLTVIKLLGVEKRNNLEITHEYESLIFLSVIFNMVIFPFFLVEEIYDLLFLI